jgi:hypothetical protein
VCCALYLLVQISVAPGANAQLTLTNPVVPTYSAGIRASEWSSLRSKFDALDPERPRVIFLTGPSGVTIRRLPVRDPAPPPLSLTIVSRGGLSLVCTVW